MRGGVPVVPNFYSLNVIFVYVLYFPPRNLRDIFYVKCSYPCRTAKRISVTLILFVGILI